MGVIAGRRALLAAQNRLKAFLHELLTYLRHHGHIGVERLYDLTIAPALALSGASALSSVRAFSSRLAGLFPLLITLADDCVLLRSV